MPNRRRSLSAENPLLGMIVDRTSFDEDDQVSVTGSKKAQSFDDGDDSLSVYSSSSVGMRRTRSGKVRRKLRWKPPAFRSRRNNNSSAASVMSQSVKSNKTNKSSMSFHTFHSTETPVRDNKRVATPVKIGRPHYSDSFEGVATINNEGRYVHARMAQHTRQRNIPRSQTMPPSRNEKGRGGLDFNTFSTDDVTEAFESESVTFFDPYGDGMAAWNNRQLPPRKRSSPQLSMSAPATPRQSPRRNGEYSQEPRSGTPSTVDSSMSDVSASGFPVLESEDFEGDRLVTILGKASPKRVIDVADAATGWDISMSQIVGAQSPSGTFSMYASTPPKTKQHSSMGRPPTSPISPSSRLEKPERRDRDSPENSTDGESFEAVPAKVNVRLSSLSSLKEMVAHSGLLNGSQYLPKRLFSEVPVGGGSTHKSYNRPTNGTSSVTSVSTDGIQTFSDDDSISTKNSIESGDVMIEDLQAPPQSNGYENEHPQNGNSRKARRSTGPVDLDDGTFLEAEKNLRAIHDMAAEHLEHGEFEEALEVFEEILRGQKTRYGPDHYRVGTALHNIGIVHLKSKQFEKAVKVCQQAAEVRKGALVANHPDIAVSFAQLGVAHLEFGQYTEALVAFREALVIRRELLGRKHPKVGKLLNNIGCALVAVDKLEDAKLAFEEALDIQRETLRSDSSSQSNRILLSIASTLCNLVSIRVHWGLYEEASVSLEEALLIQQSVLGDDHPVVLNTINSIEFVDRAINGGDASSGSYNDLYTCHATTEFLLPDLDDAEEVRIDCAAAEPAGKRLTNVSFMQMFGLDKSKRWYNLIEQNMLVTENATCSPSGHSGVKDSGRRKKKRTTAEI